MTMKHADGALPKAQAGVALVEFALALPILMMLLVGIIEYGRYTYFGIEIGNAAHAGAEYGSQSASTGADVTGMKNAAIADGQNAIFPLNTSAVAAQDVCTCWSGTAESPSPPTAAACGQPCTTAGARPVTYAQVTVTGTLTPLFNYSMLGLPSSWTVARTARIRILQQ
jgi:Flp pilus assembly protein TadG